MSRFCALHVRDPVRGSFENDCNASWCAGLKPFVFESFCPYLAKVCPRVGCDTRTNNLCALWKQTPTERAARGSESGMEWETAGELHDTELTVVEEPT